MNFLVTGAGGFLGKSIAKKISQDSLYLLSRKTTPIKCLKNYIFDLEDCCAINNGFFEGVSVVIHCAAVVHLSDEGKDEVKKTIEKINFDSTVALAEKAAASGVKRFVFISTIGVNGSISTFPFDESMTPRPHNFYALSKYRAEEKLLELSEKYEMDVVIVRPPLIYGPNASGSFSVIVNLIKKSFPLPFSLLSKNKRSFIALENLVDFVLLCADYKKTPQAANQLFLISDGEDVSTVEFFKRVAIAYNVSLRLFPIPAWLISIAVKLIGKKNLVHSLLGSLQVDNEKAKKLLGWKPVVTMNEQLYKIAKMDRMKSKRN